MLRRKESSKDNKTTKKHKKKGEEIKKHSSPSHHSDSSNLTAFISAVANGNLAEVKNLIETKNVDPGSCDLQGRPIIFLGLADLAVTTYLLVIGEYQEDGDNILRKNRNGETLLDMIDPKTGNTLLHAAITDTALTHRLNNLGIRNKKNKEGLFAFDLLQSNVEDLRNDLAYATKLVGEQAKADTATTDNAELEELRKQKILEFEQKITELRKEEEWLHQERLAIEQSRQQNTEKASELTEREQQLALREYTYQQSRLDARALLLGEEQKLITQFTQNDMRAEAAQVVHGREDDKLRRSVAPLWTEKMQQFPNTLHEAAKNSSKNKLDHQYVVYYLEKGGDPNARDTYQATLLHRAASAGNVELCQLLIEKGARVDYVDQTHLRIIDYITTSKLSDKQKVTCKDLVFSIALYWNPRN